jgi:hypothetical protein
MKLIADIQFSRELAGFPIGDDSLLHLAQLNRERQMLGRAAGLHAPSGPLQALRGNDCVCEVLGCRRDFLKEFHGDCNPRRRVP